MRDDTPTTQTLDRLKEYGYDEDFIVFITHYSPNLVKEAFKGYISFMGPTLDKLIDLADLTELLNDDPDVRVHPADFIQQQVVTNAETNTEMMLGKLWEAGSVSRERIIEIARQLDNITTTQSLGMPDHSYRVPRHYNPVSGIKAGVKQVW